MERKIKVTFRYLDNSKRSIIVKKSFADTIWDKLDRPAFANVKTIMMKEV